MEQIAAAIADHWSKVSSRPHPGKVRWWQSPTVWRYINGLIEGGNAADADGAFHRLISKTAGRVLNRAISVGCGTAEKEMKLLAMGAVKYFDVFELSESRIEAGKLAARERRIEDRITFHAIDAFNADLGKYDLVYWNNSLHHMLDVADAVDWSSEHISLGGYFAMDDFVGPSRFQWRDSSLKYSNAFRALLPEAYLRHPTVEGAKISIERTRPAVADMIAMDPSEAAESDLILGNIRTKLPGATIIPTGGCIYQLALDDVLVNFDEVTDLHFLQSALLLDKMMIELGETHYAVALWKKPL